MPLRPVRVQVHWKSDQPMRASSAVAILHQWCCLLDPSVRRRYRLAGEIQEKYKDFHARLPQDHLPFLNDPGGSLFLIRLGPSDNGVYYWDRQFEGDAIVENGQPILYNVGFVAKCFEEFLSAAKPEPEV